MPNTEKSNKWLRHITDESGGSVKADGTVGGEVILTADGEVSFQVGEQGELTVISIQKGIVCAYLDDTRLAFVTVEVGTYLDNFSAEQLEVMAHEGDDILTLVDDLNENHYCLFLTVFPQIGKAMLQLRDVYQEEVVQESTEGINFDKGFLSYVGFGDDMKLCFQAVHRGDEFVIALGEMDGNRRTLVPLSFGNEVDYITEICSGRSNRYQTLAKKVLLG